MDCVSGSYGRTAGYPESDTRRAKLAVTMPVPMTASQVELLFTNVVDQIMDILDILDFIACNFHASKVLQAY
jgi:hypothetical protein